MTPLPADEESGSDMNMAYRLIRSVLSRKRAAVWGVISGGALLGGAMLISPAAAVGDAAEPPVWPSDPKPLPSESQTKIGYVETVIVYPAGMRIKAKVDTGALSSSLDATDIRPFSKDGKDWVRVTLRGDRESSRRIDLPVVRTVHIRRAEVPLQERYVVQIGICLGDRYKLAEVSLIDRNDLNYRMLIGRSFLKGSFVIDPAAAFLTRPSCESH
jgi:hypothetical protein